MLIKVAMNSSAVSAMARWQPVPFEKTATMPLKGQLKTRKPKILL
jgi:hypothetical protein